MLISVVIATHDRLESLSACLASLLEQDFAPERYEVVVVVDGSRDGTREWLRSHSSRERWVVVEQDNKGPAAARNAGARIARGDVLLFLDDDLACEPGLLSAHADAHSDGVPRLAFGRMVADSPAAHARAAERLAHDAFVRYYDRLDRDPRPVWPDDAWAGPNCSLPRDAFVTSGGFDEPGFPRRMEDLDLGLRLWSAGLEFRYVARAITTHRWTKSDADCWRDAQGDGAGTVAICRRHPAYRPHAPVPGVAAAPPWKRWIVSCASALPGVFRLGNDALRGAMECFPQGSGSRQAADRLFVMRQGIGFVAGALREAGSWRSLDALFGRRMAALLYHHVGPPLPAAADPSLTVSPERFESHLRWLRKRGYTGITAAQWLAWRNEGAPLPDRPVMLTFDDGLSAFTKHALPALERNGFNAVQFVITGLAEEASAWEGQAVMTADAIRDCRDRGIEIGAHSRTHPELTAVPPADVQAEVTGAKRDLQAMGIEATTFAYPFGCHDEHVRACVAREFAVAFTCDEGLNDLRTDLLSLRRTMVQPGDTLLDIELRAAFGCSPLNEVRSALRLRSRARWVGKRLSRLFGLRREAA